jgi:hypothetical protein
VLAFFSLKLEFGCAFKPQGLGCTTESTDICQIKFDYTLVDYVFSNVGLFSSHKNMASATCTSSGNILKWSVNDWVFEDSIPTTAILQGTLLFLLLFLTLCI